MIRAPIAGYALCSFYHISADPRSDEPLVCQPAIARMSGLAASVVLWPGGAFDLEEPHARIGCLIVMPDEQGA
jgi:hypothetical protein